MMDLGYWRVVQDGVFALNGALCVSTNQFADASAPRTLELLTDNSDGSPESCEPAQFRDD
jgi:hypothetical protein